MSTLTIPTSFPIRKGLFIFVTQPYPAAVLALHMQYYRFHTCAVRTVISSSKYSLVPTDNSAGNFVKVQQRIPVRIDLENLSQEDTQYLRAGMMVETEALRK